MRSSTPANEILQTFHKVHPSYQAAWSLEMKSLLRKVTEWRVTYMHNAQYTVGADGSLLFSLYTYPPTTTHVGFFHVCENVNTLL